MQQRRKGKKKQATAAVNKMKFGQLIILAVALIALSLLLFRSQKNERMPQRYDDTIVKETSPPTSAPQSTRAVPPRSNDFELWKPSPNHQISPFIAKLHALHPVRPFYPSFTDLVELFHHGKNPYTGMSAGDPKQFEGYPSFAQVMSGTIQEGIIRLLGNERPRFFVEVGSFIGSGMVHTWAPLVSGHQSGQGLVLSMDSWLGDVNMRVLPNFEHYLANDHGVPTLAHRFMRRMVHENLTTRVVPLPLPSLVGARLLAMCEFIVDGIYVDSAHERGETFAELLLFYQILRMGGVLCGDDYATFPAVEHDVNRFAQEFNLEIVFLEPRKIEWCIKKVKDLV